MTETTMAFDDMQTLSVGIRHLYISLFVGSRIQKAGNYPCQWTLLRWYGRVSSVDMGIFWPS